MGLKVRGFASVFRNKDLGNEVVDPGAFTDWLKSNPATALRIYWNHAHIYTHNAKPIGITTKLTQKAKGLYFEGELHDTAEGLEVGELLKAGPLQASFAYKILDRYEEKGVWHLKTLHPREVTAANFGMNPKAYIEALPGQTTPDALPGQETES